MAWHDDKVKFLPFKPSFISCLKMYNRNDSLENHIATVAKFSNSFRHASAPDRPSLFQQFTHHIVACCWKKMHRRINGWGSRGLVYHLGQTTNADLTASYKALKLDMPPAHKSNSALVTELLRLQEADGIGLIMEQYRYPEVVMDVSALRQLMGAATACQNKVKGTTLYNEQMCFQFHQLLMAVLVGYWKAVVELRQANADSANSSNPYALVALALKVWHFAHLLWRIAYSDALRKHLGVLSAAKLLCLPRNSSALRKKYADFLQSSSHSPEVDDDDNGDVKDCLEGQDDLPVTFCRWLSLQV